MREQLEHHQSLTKEKSNECTEMLRQMGDVKRLWKQLFYMLPLLWRKQSLGGNFEINSWLKFQRKEKR